MPYQLPICPDCHKREVECFDGEPMAVCEYCADRMCAEAQERDEFRYYHPSGK